MIGFFEESAGVRSMTRLCAFLMSVVAALLGLALAIYILACHALTNAPPDAGVIAAFAAPITGLAAGVWGALRARSGGDAS